GGPAAALLLIDDRLTEFDALAADVHVAGAFDERADVAVALAAKRAVGVAVAAGASRRPAPATPRAGGLVSHASSSFNRRRGGGTGPGLGGGGFPPPAPSKAFRPNGFRFKPVKNSMLRG